MRHQNEAWEMLKRARKSRDNFSVKRTSRYVLDREFWRVHHEGGIFRFQKHAQTFQKNILCRKVIFPRTRDQELWFHQEWCLEPEKRPDLGAPRGCTMTPTIYGFKNITNVLAWCFHGDRQIFRVLEAFFIFVYIIFQNTIGIMGRCLFYWEPSPALDVCA